MQNSLFPDLDDPASGAGIAAATPAPALVEVADALPGRLRFGTSSWNFPGWAGLVWDREYPEATLSRFGLPAYASHPLLLWIAAFTDPSMRPCLPSMRPRCPTISASW